MQSRNYLSSFACWFSHLVGFTLTDKLSEGRKVLNYSIPGAYLQTDLPKDKLVLLLSEGKFVDIMSEINPEYKQQVRTKDGRNTLYIRILKAIYGIIESALL